MPTTVTHKDLNGDDLHSIARWVVADVAALEALVPEAEDTHKVAYVTETKKYWALVAHSPVEWVCLNEDVPEPVDPPAPVEVDPIVQTLHWYDATSGNPTGSIPITAAGYSIPRVGVALRIVGITFTQDAVVGSEYIVTAVEVEWDYAGVVAIPLKQLAVLQAMDYLQTQVAYSYNEEGHLIVEPGTIGFYTPDLESEEDDSLLAIRFTIKAPSDQTGNMTEALWQAYGSSEYTGGVCEAFTLAPDGTVTIEADTSL